MSDYTLPDGFRWIEQSEFILEFQHVASGKSGGISQRFLPAPRTDGVQREIDYLCAKILREAKLDALWMECGGDRDRFAKLREAVN